MPKTTINGIGLYYEVMGEGKPLVLIQGLTGGHDGWFYQVPAFSKHYKVITYDNRGIGMSDVSPQPYTVPDMAGDVVGLMDHLGVEKAHILGLSMGGMVSQEIAVSHPQRVDRLVLSNTLAGGSINDMPQDLISKLGVMPGLSSIDNMAVDRYRFINLFVSAAFNKWQYRLFFNLGSRLSNKSQAHDYLGQIRAVKDFDSRSRLHLIQAPTLIITGTGDRIIQPQLSEAMAKLIPNARLVNIKGGSHALFIELHRRFNKEVLDFLDGSPLK